MAGETIEHGFLRAVDGIITEIGSLENGAVPNQEENEAVWDLQGADVYPGFIDAHTHIGMWEDGLNFEGDDGNEDTDPITPSFEPWMQLTLDRCFRKDWRLVLPQ